MVKARIMQWAGALGLVVVLAFGFTATDAMVGSNVAVAQEAGNVPGNSIGNMSDAQMWRKIRGGVEGQVSIPDKQAGILVQSDGDVWRAWRNGAISTYGAWGLGIMIAIIAAFYLIRGRIRIDGGLSGKDFLRFQTYEVFAHWVMAFSFIVLAITGLNVLYGRYVLLPIIGPEAFAWITQMGKYAHNYMAFPFMFGFTFLFFMWVKNNLPDKYDLNWIKQAGGLFHAHKHPPAAKFNAGQKVIFWSTMITGVILSISGVNLLWPFAFGTIQDMQDWHIIHTIASLIAIAVIIGHIYIGSLGMEGAFSAISTGHVDEEWAREHHAAWVAEVKGEPIPGPNDDPYHDQHPEAPKQPAE